MHTFGAVVHALNRSRLISCRLSPLSLRQRTAVVLAVGRQLCRCTDHHLLNHSLVTWLSNSRHGVCHWRVTRHCRSSCRKHRRSMVKDEWRRVPFAEGCCEASSSFYRRCCIAMLSLCPSSSLRRLAAVQHNPDMGYDVNMPSQLDGASSGRNASQSEASTTSECLLGVEARDSAVSRTQVRMVPTTSTPRVHIAPTPPPT